MLLTQKICPCSFCSRGRIAALTAVWTWVDACLEGVGIKRLNNQSRWDQQPKGEPKGRINMRNGWVVEICLPVKEFRAWFDRSRMSECRLANLKQRECRTVRLTPNGKPIKCFIFGCRFRKGYIENCLNIFSLMRGGCV